MNPNTPNTGRQAPPLVVPPIALPLPAVPPVPTALSAPVKPVTTATDPLQDDAAALAQLSIKNSLINDSDLIEKAWVNKAKQIVEQTRDDPYKQSEELTIFKADYMKKQYDKSIKLSK
jgi:hypothetical protein